MDINPVIISQNYYDFMISLCLKFLKEKGSLEPLIIFADFLKTLRKHQLLVCLRSESPMHQQGFGALLC